MGNKPKSQTTNTTSTTNTTNNDSGSKSNNGFVLTITPFTGLTLLVLFAAILFSWDQYRDSSFCEIIKADYNDKTEWITAPDHKNKEEYLKYEQGTFIYRHIYMENFEEVFGVKPAYFPVIDNDIAPYLDKHDLRSRLLNLNSSEINPAAIQAILRESDNYAPQIDKIKYAVENETYVDDGGIYIRWINDLVRYGMYSAKTFKRRDMLGVYSGLVTRQLSDLEYAWEFNYLVDVKDDDDNKVRVCIDAKHIGNYMRFANHRDKNQNGDQLYAVYGDLWHVLYIAQMDINPHDQIFVNYGQGYWENKKKYDF